jgi:hypothetical protein
MPLTTISVTGSFQDFTETGLSGSVTFTPTTAVVDSGGSLILAASPVVTTVAGGTMTPVTLVTTDNAGLSPAGWQYNVSIAVPGMTQSYTTFLPHTGSTVDLSALTTVPAPSTPTGLYVQSVNGYSGQITISVVSGVIKVTQGA